eukprot:scaffold52179_cov20-Prasinocladus_malaysianus.AAC.1
MSFVTHACKRCAVIRLDRFQKVVICPTIQVCSSGDMHSLEALPKHSSGCQPASTTSRVTKYQIDNVRLGSTD